MLSGRAGIVRITGIDGAGSRYGPITLSLAAYETRHFDSRELESGNASSAMNLRRAYQPLHQRSDSDMKQRRIRILAPAVSA